MKRFSNFFFIMVILFLTSCSNNKNLNNLRLFFFDVSQGDSSLINYKGVSVLIDTGDEKFTDEVIKTLKRNNIKTLHYVILSHDHADHVSGFKNILSSFNIKNILLPEALKEDTFKEVKSLIDKDNTKITHINSGSLKIFDDFVLNFLPQPKNIDEFNDSSLVFRASIKDFDILYTGDIEENGQSNLLNYNIESEVLKVPIMEPTIMIKIIFLNL